MQSSTKESQCANKQADTGHCVKQARMQDRKLASGQTSQPANKQNASLQSNKHINHTTK